MPGKVPFGGYTINFKGQMTTIEDLMGKDPIPPTEMMKKLWAHVKAKKLSSSAKKK